MSCSSRKTYHKEARHVSFEALITDCKWPGAFWSAKQTEITFQYLIWSRNPFNEMLRSRPVPLDSVAWWSNDRRVFISCRASVFRSTRHSTHFLLSSVFRAPARDFDVRGVCDVQLVPGALCATSYGWYYWDSLMWGQILWMIVWG